MKKLLGIVLISIMAVVFYYYWSSIIPYLLIVLEITLYAVAGLAAIVGAIYIKDRMAYHKLKRDMWKEAHSE
ncbi:MAG: hypothetical protein KDC79_09920 [Cyclobacteriaceae bacterium]|nr:hypothetical protein [Cyclobacteriaceae bacterium]